MKAYMITKEKFESILKRVLKHNNDIGQYGDNATISITADECDKRDLWSPCDLIIREQINNIGRSARGFLGISAGQCWDAYFYIKTHKEELKPLISQNGWSNSGCALWSNWDF